MTDPNADIGTVPRMIRLEEDAKKNWELLIRIDERTQLLVEDMKNLKEKFVRKEEFVPVRNAVYGLLATIVLGVLGALVRLVVNSAG